MHSNSSKLFYRQRELTWKILPFSATTLWRKVKDGSFPKPVKMVPSISAWKASEVEAWLKMQENQSTNF